MLGTKSFLTDILLFDFSIRTLCFPVLKYFKNLVCQPLDFERDVHDEGYSRIACTHKIRYLCF